MCVDAKKALQRTFEVQRKAKEIQEDVAAHRERTRRIWVKPQQAAAKATHSLACGVPDRESTETKYLRRRRSSLRSGNIDFKVGNRWVALPPNTAK